jgi:DNA repair exonuclease SbcCD ATPase subunit
MSDQRNWLERLGDKIPGYGGYVSKERRRDADKLQREHLAERLRAAKQPLNELMRELSSSGRLFEVGPVDRVLKKIDQIENRVRFASYGYAGFFDAVKIQEAQLDAIYRFDLALVEKVERLEALAREAGQKSSTAEGLKQAAAEIEAAADDLNRTFDERYRAIENFRPDGTEGQPMFS